MRKSFDGLCGLIQDHFPDELLDGSFYIFSNRRQNCIKIIYWDKDGIAIWYKRLEKGRFDLPGTGEKTVLKRGELMVLLEGIVPLKYNKRFTVN